MISCRWIATHVVCNLISLLNEIKAFEVRVETVSAVSAATNVTEATQSVANIVTDGLCKSLVLACGGSGDARGGVAFQDFDETPK